MTGLRQHHPNQAQATGLSPSGREAGRQIRRPWFSHRLACLILLSALVLSGCSAVQDSVAPVINVPSGDSAASGGITVGTQLLVGLTVLSMVPAFLIMVTSFTRVTIVLSFIRSAVGVPQVPPTPVLLGLSLFLTVFIMAPVWKEVNTEALQPYLQQSMDQDTALERGLKPVRTFMLKQTREKDLALFLYLAREPRPRTPDEIPTHVMVPAFVISELKTAFQMGFIILVPFLIIDLVVSTTLMSMGMMMLPPSIISLPFKVLLFVLVDGWHLIMRSLVLSFT